MPISFLILGIFLIYLLFYKENFMYKTAFTILLIFIIIGYFVPPINIMNGVMFNFLFFIPLFIIDIYYIVKLEKLNIFIFTITFILSSIIYSLLVIFDIEKSTLFPFYLIFFITLALTICQSFNLNISIPFVISSYLIFDILNIVLIKQSMGVVSILTVEVMNAIVITILISIVFNKLFLYVSQRIKEKKINV